MKGEKGTVSSYRFDHKICIFTAPTQERSLAKEAREGEGERGRERERERGRERKGHLKSVNCMSSKCGRDVVKKAPSSRDPDVNRPPHAGQYTCAPATPRREENSHPG